MRIPGKESSYINNFVFNVFVGTAVVTPIDKFFIAFDLSQEMLQYLGVTLTKLYNNR